MNWINEPIEENVEARIGCLVRICPSKKYCGGYSCIILSERRD